MQTIDVGKTARGWRECVARFAVAGTMLVGVMASALPAAAQGTPEAQGTPLAMGAAPAAAKGAPADAAAFIAFDTDTNSAQWTQASDLLARLGLPDAADMWKAHAAEHESGGMGTPPTQAQIDALTGGQIAVAVTSQAALDAVEAAFTQSSGNGGMDESQAMADMHNVEGVAAIVQPSDPDVAWDYVQQQFGNMAQQMGVQVEQTQIDGADVIAVSPGPGGTPVASPVAMDQMDSMYGMGMDHQHGGAAARVGDLILAGSTADDLQPFIDAASGAAPSLADAPELAEVQANLPTQDGLVFAYANTAGVVDGLDPQIKDAIRSMSPVLQDEAAWKMHVGAIGWADANGFRLDTIAIGANGYDLSKVVPPNQALTVDQKVPADTLLFTGGYQLPGAWDSLALSLAQAVNEGMAEMGMGTPTAMPMATPTNMGQMFSPEYIEQQIAQATNILGFNPRDDLFGQFQGEYVFALGAPTIGAGGFDVAALFATDLGDPSKVASSLDNVARLIGSLAIKNSTTTTIAARQIGSDQVYSIKDSSMPNLPIEFGIVDGRFVLGIGKGVDNFVGGATSNLASNPQYQQVMALLPSDHYQVVYVDLKQIVTLAMAFSGMGGSAMRDADAACANFSDQAAAQAAYDADPMTNLNLDQNFNGQACEDFFAAPGATPTAAAGSLANLEAFGETQFVRDGMLGSSAILVIGGGS